MPRDTKPFSKAKKAAIVRIAGKDRRLKGLLEGRGEVVLVEPNLADRRRPEGKEQAVLAVYDHDSDRSLVVLVDPKREKVLAVEDTPARFQLSDDERAEAEALAAKDDRVRAFLHRRRMNPLTRLYFPPGDGPSHRYAIVFLRPTTSERRYAVVDLTDKKVIDMLGPEALTAKGGQT
jgi:hypothetical protein